MSFVSKSPAFAAATAAAVAAAIRGTLLFKGLFEEHGGLGTVQVGKPLELRGAASILSGNGIGRIGNSPLWAFL